MATANSGSHVVDPSTTNVTSHPAQDSPHTSLNQDSPQDSQPASRQVSKQTLKQTSKQPLRQTVIAVQTADLTKTHDQTKPHDQTQDLANAQDNAMSNVQSNAMSQAKAQAQTQTKMQPKSFQDKLKRFLRLNILAIAISLGVIIYFLFHYVEFLAPIKYPIKNFANAIIPYFIFTMLFIAFCKVEVRKMRPRRWHFLLIVLQLGIPLLIALLIRSGIGAGIDVELEGAIACIVVPTAAAASVITGKLGGDESSLTTYTIMSNLGAAIGIPLIFPLVSEAAAQSDFLTEFWIITVKVFPMIVLPLIVAQFIRWFVKPLHRFIVTKLKEAAFYLWALTLTCISATAVSNMMNSKESGMTLILLAIIGLITTLGQFGLGKLIGHMDGQRISGGQGLGQKNMVFGIWVTYSYLSPAAAIAPGCYILWQNIFNSWQLWYRDFKHLTYTDKMS